MRNALWGLLLAGCVGSPVDSGPGNESDALEVEDFGSNPGQVKLFLKAPTHATDGAGLVVALHGCLQTAADFRQVGLEALGERHGFYVLYVQAPSANGCFRWFEPTHARRGQGETASVVAGVEWVLAHAPVDRRKVFLFGLSAGAAMGAQLLASSPEVFAAGALFAGVPAGCAQNSTEGMSCMRGVQLDAATWAQRASMLPGFAPPRVQIWTGANDTTVSPTMATELFEQWSALHGLALDRVQHETFRRLTSDSVGVGALPSVQRMTVASMGHAVPLAVSRGCGTVAPFLDEVDVCGALEAVRFFGLVAAPPSSEPPPVEWLDGGVADPTPAVDAGTTFSSTCRESLATPTWHVWLRHAQVCGYFRSLACTVGTDEVLGSLLSPVPVTAHAGADGGWAAGPCP